MSYRFIFDTNILDDDSIEKLRNGGIIAACNSGKFAFYMTPILLKERLHFITEGKIPLQAKTSLNLLVDLKWQRIFNEPNGPEGICAQEIEGKNFRSAYLFKDNFWVKERLKFLLNGGEFTKEEKQEIREYLETWTESKRNNVKVYRTMRNDITEKTRQNKNLSRKDSDFNFKNFLKDNFEQTAIEKIQTSINSKTPKNQLVEYWLNHKQMCPYFNKFIEGYLFIMWYFMAEEKDPKMDVNTHEDIEHLIYLIGLNGIVSNETRFIKTACKELFPDKDFFSVDQFVSRLNQKYL